MTAKKRATETAEERETRLAQWRLQELRTAEGQDTHTILALRREQDRCRTAERHEAMLTQWREQDRAWKPQETADSVLHTHSHIVVPHDDLNQSQNKFSHRLAPLHSLVSHNQSKQTNFIIY